MFKRKISLIIVLMMVLSLMIPNFAFGATNDYSNHWAEKSIQKWFDNGQLSGYEDGSFKPDQTVTRAEFMTMVNSAFEFTAKDDISFSDVKSSDWYYEELQKAAAAGYIIGYTDNTARPGNKITRQEAALIISRIKELSDSSTSAKVFTDYNEIAAWSVGGVGAVAKAKIMIGYEDNSFRPDRFISRAEALVTIDRSMGDVPVIDNPSTGGSTGGGGGGGDTDPAPNYAQLNGLTIVGADLQQVYDVSRTTYSAIAPTTSSAITITAVTATGTSIVATVTGTGITGTAIVTTQAAIGGGVESIIHFEYEGEPINAEVTLTVSGSEYDTKPYTITIIRE